MNASVAANGILTALLLGWLLMMNARAVTVEVSPRFAYAPAKVVVRVRVQPNAENRGLYVEADGHAYRSSFIQLDGEDARITNQIEWMNLEAGAYAIRAAVANSVGKVIASAQTTLQVLGNQ